jgi:hypothetical protein
LHHLPNELFSLLEMLCTDFGRRLLLHT